MHSTLATSSIPSSAAVDNFYLSDAELADSPSRAHGIDADKEVSMRILGAELIQEAGVLLKCPQAVMATGQILMQRFYCKKSLKEYNVLVRTSV